MELNSRAPGNYSSSMFSMPRFRTLSTPFCVHCTLQQDKDVDPEEVEKCRSPSEPPPSYREPAPARPAPCYIRTSLGGGSLKDSSWEASRTLLPSATSSHPDLLSDVVNKDIGDSWVLAESFLETSV